PQEFWSPSAATSELPLSDTLAGTCRRCASEFIVDAKFCHVCGASRPSLESASGWQSYTKHLRALEFHRVQSWFGLSTPSLVAFLLGIGCLFGALVVGLMYSVQSLADFQAIQLWRIEWLLGALAAFVAGILLKRNQSPEN